MKHIPLLMIAGIAGIAAAQDTMTFTWVITDNGDQDGIIEPGETGYAYLWTEMDPLRVGFAGTVFDLHHDGVGWFEYASISDLLVTYQWGDGDSTVQDVAAFQVPPFFNPDFNYDNPIYIFYFGITPDDYTPHTISFYTDSHENWVYTDEFGTSVEYDSIINGGSFRVVPAPASLAFLSIAGLATGRRR